MLTLPSKFQTELNKAVNTPSFLVKLEDGTLYNEQTLQADWAANTQASQIDYLTQAGSVLVESTIIPENLIGDNWTALYLKPIGTGAQAGAYWQNWQSIKQQTGSGKSLQSIKGYFKANPTAIAQGAAVRCTLFASNKTTPVGSLVNVAVTSGTGEWLTFNFSGQGLTLSHDTVYWIKFTCPLVYSGAATASVSQYSNTTSLYSLGQFDRVSPSGIVSANVGETVFQIVLSGGFYKPSGYIRTRTMDIGSTPAEIGEWVFEDIQPTGTSITYQAWASSTGTFTGEETDLGAVVDGDSITNLKRYYRVKATLTANGGQSVSPTLQSIKADFTTFKTYSDNPSLGHETAVLSVSSLSSSIDTFKPSTIGQITFSLNLSPSVSNYLATKKPKNKLVQVKAGFVADGFTEADYINYSWGQIDDWKITSKDEVTLTVKDFSKEWDVDVPKAITGETLPQVVWGGSVTIRIMGQLKTFYGGISHPIDVMLDILKNHINARDSKILGSSFGDVKTLLPDWIVSRTLKEDTVSAKDLMEELRLLTQTYFLSQANGKIKIKRWNADESPIDTLTDADFISKRWDSDAKQIINRYVHFYGWDGEGDEAADYNTVSIGIDTTSQTNWRETTSKELKDKWTPITQTAQVSDFLDKIMKRYANPPSILQAEVDLRKIALEVGDIVTVTTSRAPSTDMAGISNIKFQIVNRNLDYSKRTLSLTMLECASSVNTQVEAPVAQPTPYDLPDQVVGLAIVEQKYINKDSSYTPLIVVTYDLPDNSTYWSHAIIQTSIDGGLTYKDYGLDYLNGNGFIIDASKVGGFVGGIFEVRVISVNTQGIQSPSATAPTASFAKIGAATVLTDPPAAIRGLSIEGNPDPNNTQWDGLRFGLTWWKASQTGGAGGEGGLGAGGFVDPYWNGDEYELWVGGSCIDKGITKEARYDYVYGDGYLAFLDAKIAAANGTVTFKVRRVSLNQPSEWSTITITQAAPANPAGLTGTGMSRSVLFAWDMSAEADFDYYSLRTKIGSGGTWSSWSSIAGNSYLRTFTQAELTGGSLAVYIEVKAVDLYGNMSGAASTNAATWMIVPDELYTTLRTDFWVRDSIFNFGDSATAPSQPSKTTLYWTVGSITRAAETFTLAGSPPPAGLASANNKYVIATLSGGVATLSLADMTAGIPALNANQVIIATTSYAPNTAGNYLCFIRQANSMMIEGAIIRDLTVTSAKITSLTAGKVVTGILTDAIGNNYWNLDTGAAVFSGSITIKGTNITTIQDGATNGATWGTNLAGRPPELTDGRVATALNSSGTVVTKVVPASVAGAGAAGLYLGSDYLGYYNGSAWKTYMQDNGNFYLSGTSTHYLAWDGAALTVRGSLNADDITAGAIRGIGVYGSTHATKGSYLTATCSASDTTIYIKDTTDFPSSGSGWIIDSANDRDAISWTGKTATTLTGCSGVLAHTVSASNVPVVVPAVKAMVMADIVNEMRFFGDRGDGTVEELASIGINLIGGDYQIGKFGSPNSSRQAIYAESGSQHAIFAVTTGTLNHGVLGRNLSTLGYGIAGQGGFADIAAINSGVVLMSTRLTDPSGSTNGGRLYTKNGALYFKGGSDTITLIANA